MNTKKHKLFNSSDLEKRFGVMTFGLFIKAFREADNLSQTQFANKLNISRANLCDLEKGRKIASPLRAARIAKKIGVAPELLVKLTLQDSLRQAKLQMIVDVRAA
jgi:transcriptional regulator with XRE-family HTH domain